MANAFDYKKEFKDLYMPPTKPKIVDVPEMTFLMVDGKGNPNTAQAYQDAMEVLYGLSWTIKMSKMSGTQPEGYFEYVMPPLEGLWWLEDGVYDSSYQYDKDQFCWTSMIRQPEFVTLDAFEQAKAALAKKKPGINTSYARLATWTEGPCVQIMHIGPYDTEPASVRAMADYAMAEGYRIDLTDERKHHEIYLGDPRKIAPEKRKTVIRHPIAKP